MRAYLYYGYRQLISRTGGKSYRRIRAAILGIGLSLVPMIVVIEVSNGLIRGITERYIEVGSYHLQARNFGGVNDEIFELAVEKAAEVSRVVVAQPLRYGIGLLQSAHSRIGATVRALSPEAVEKDPAYSKYIEVIGGRFVLDDPSSILLSGSIAATLGVGINDTIKMIGNK